MLSFLKHNSILRNREFRSILVIEILSIFLSILAAFWLTNWQERAAERRQVANALEQCLQEVRVNHSQLTNAVERHRSLVDSLRMHSAEQVDTHALGYIQRFMQPGGFGPPILRDMAWATMQSTGVLQYMDWEEATDVARVYLLQEQMLEPVLERLMALALGRESYDPALGKSQVMAITVLITEVLTIEESLLEQYDRFIEEYAEK